MNGVRQQLLLIIFAIFIVTLSSSSATVEPFYDAVQEDLEGI